MAKTLKSVPDVLLRKPSASDRAEPFTETQWLPIGLILLNSVLSTVSVLLTARLTASPDFDG
jgi:hypothetical protein